MILDSSSTQVSNKSSTTDSQSNSDALADQRDDINDSSSDVMIVTNGKSNRKRQRSEKTQDDPRPKRAKKTTTEQNSSSDEDIMPASNQRDNVRKTTNNQAILDPIGGCESACCDYKYLSSLLHSTYTKEVLATSSYGGTKSNFTGIAHISLDAEKMKIIRSMYLQNTMQMLTNFLIVFIENFEQRVKSDQKRLKKLPFHVNKICSNSRRGTKKRDKDINKKEPKI